MAPSLPHRVPNPPKVFVGRETECEQLVQLLEQGTVAWVCGAGGTGKSALVRQALRVGPPSWAAQAVQVSMGPTDSLDDTLCRLLEVLQDAPYDPDTVASGASLNVAALSAAESTKRTIVLDDLHHASPQALLDFCSLLSDYALHSRWILVAREFPPGLDSPEQLVWLKPMAGEALRDLASRCGCAAPDLDEAVQVAAGSPLRLRQWVACRQQRGHLKSAPPQARQLLRLLAQLEHPVTMEHAQRLVPLPPAHVLEALEHSGWLQQSASESGLRMHDLLAADVVDDLSQAERRADAQAIAWSLDDATDIETAIAAIAATVEVEDLDTLSSLLDAHGARLLERGRGAWLWRQLTRQPQPMADRWAFRAAIRARTADTIAWLVVQPRPAEGDLLVLWLEGQLIAARPLVVMSETEVVTCPMTAAEAVWVQLQRARAQMSVNAMEDVVETLSAVVPASDDVAAVRDALLARAYMHLGQQIRALAVMRGGPDLPLSPRLRSIVDEQRTFVVMASGHAGDGQSLLAMADSPDASTSSRLLLAGRLLMAGHLERARAIVEPLDDGPLNEGERVLAPSRCWTYA